MKASHLAGNNLIILAVVFTAYLSVVMTRRINAVVLKDTYRKIFLYELAACAFFLLFALDVRFDFLGKIKNRVLLICCWIPRFLVILVCGVLLFFMIRVTVGSLSRSAEQAGKAVVLGLALENGKPTEDLIARLDEAEKYAAENPEAVLILTGGNPDESGQTEAAVMRDLLLERGLPEDRMMLEDQAETTKENFRNIAGMIDAGEPVALITSNYHMDRAVRTARSAGFTQVLPKPASSSAVLYPANVMWETMLELNELTLKQ